MAKDLHEFLTALDRGDVVALGHSLGCSALWSYWDLFGGDRLRKLILVEPSPFLVDNPDWTRAQREAAGSLASAVDWVADSREIAASEDQLRERIEGMTNSTLDPMVMSWMIDENRKEAACRRIRANVVSA